MPRTDVEWQGAYDFDLDRRRKDMAQREVLLRNIDSKSKIVSVSKLKGRVLSAIDVRVGGKPCPVVVRKSSIASREAHPPR